MEEGSGDRQGRSGLSRWLLIGALALIGYQLFGGSFFGKGPDRQPFDVDDWSAVPAEGERTCAIETDKFRAELGTRGASLRHYVLHDPKYAIDGRAIDVVTATWSDPSANPFHGRAPLRTDFVDPDAKDPQVPAHDLSWTLAAQDGSSCTFTWEKDGTKLTKVVAATGKPYELEVRLEVKNEGKEPRTHRATLEQTANRVAKELEGSLGRQSEWMTETVASATKVERWAVTDFEPGDFKDEGFTAEKWRRAAGSAHFVGTSSSYLTQVAIPLEPPASGEVRIEEKWDASQFQPADKRKDPKFSHYYRTRLVWDSRKLGPGESASYKALTYVGPKERDLLATLGHGTSETINLGWFSPIAKILIAYVHVLFGLVRSWGFAIVLLTITVKVLLLPLSLAPMRAQAQLRKLKPEMDAIAARYKDDLTQRTLAIQELYKKHGMSQFDTLKGCLPALLQMPVFFALYTSLQTAIELYHVPFGPFIPDLSQAGKYFIIPIVLGLSSFLQQKLMPMQGDPVQAKMMLYMMPAIFTVMMLFLPAGLGVYMLTNTWFTIGQTVLVERWLKARAGGTIEVREKPTPQKAEKPSAKKGALT